uniref:FAD-binding domain-containing protein n=1 Tax=Populus trichocarpa TaxID=3694 RepID=A0A2K1YPH7_POPTR
MGHECVKINATGRSVTVTASHLKEGKYTERNISCNILVGTDGAGTPQQSLEDFSPETCKNLIFKLVGQEFSDIDVIDIKPWVMHAEVAEKYASCDNQIILAGDAAHDLPQLVVLMTNEGAILVRPDEHIAWRVKSGLDGYPILEMRRVFFCNIEELAMPQTALMDARAPEFCLLRCEYFRASQHCSEHEHVPF